MLWKLPFQALASASTSTSSSSTSRFTSRAFSSSAPSRRPENFAALAGMFAQSSSTPARQSSTPQSQAEAMLRGRAAQPQDVDSMRKLKFSAGHVIPPHDLAHDKLFPLTPRRWTKPPLFGPDDGRARKSDPFDLTGSNPLEHVYNPQIVQAFLDPLGRIRPRSVTQLTKRSQKNIGKMVRRARAMGVVGTWMNKPSRSGYGSLPSSGLSLDDDTFY